MSQAAPAATRYMQPTTACFGIWSGGVFMHYGRNIGEERLQSLIQRAYELGVRTFMTADVYGEGAADTVLGTALKGTDRDSYCLIGMIGHDFYKGQRQAEKGFPRFTDASLRGETEYKSYLEMATDKSLERLGTDHFDLLMLHNPDFTGYTSPAVWDALAALKQQGRAGLLGLAPGPANGFTLDIISTFEKFGELIDWTMIILNPLEPWPGNLVLPAAEKHNVQVMTRVVEYGGLFHGGLKPGTKLERTDHRSFRGAGWIEAAQPKLEKMAAIAAEHEMSLLQLAAQWALAQPAVKSVVPTLIQEADADAKLIEQQLEDLASVTASRALPKEVADTITRIGDNKGCMPLKGATTQYLGAPQADQWPLTPELQQVAKRWNLVPDRDLYCATDPRDIRELGAPSRNGVQASTQRLYVQFHAFTNCRDIDAAQAALAASGIECVLYEDAADPLGIGLLMLAEDPATYTGAARKVLSDEPFASMQRKPEFTMFGRTYSAGREPDIMDTLLHRPRRYAMNPQLQWAIWYPLRRKPEFELLSKEEQGKILMEHAMIGRTYGQSGYAFDIRLACYGMDQNDNEFVLGLMGPDLYPLSRLVQEMRHTTQTAKYMQNLGPFFVGKVRYQSHATKEAAQAY